MQNEPIEKDSVLDNEIDAVTCTAFVLAVFLIVPFTLLSPFRYPQPSTLDQLLSVNDGPVAQLHRPRVDGRQFGGRFRAIDLAIASSTMSADATQDLTATVRR